jgi:hypothetical protein
MARFGLTHTPLPRRCQPEPEHAGLHPLAPQNRHCNACVAPESRPARDIVHRTALAGRSVRRDSEHPQPKGGHPRSLALRPARNDHYALKIRWLSRSARTGGRPCLVCGVWVHIQTTAPCASQAYGRARGIIFDGKRPGAALPAFSCAISTIRSGWGLALARTYANVAQYSVGPQMAKFSPAISASGALARQRRFVPRIPFSARASHLLTGTVAVGLMCAATLANPSILPQSLLARATGSSAGDATAVPTQTQKPADAPLAMASDAPAATTPARQGKNSPQQLVVNTLPQNVPTAKRVEPMVAPVRRVIPKPVAPAPVVAQPAPSAPTGPTASETGPGPQAAAGPAPAVTPPPAAVEPVITPPIPVPATRPSQLAVATAPAPEPAAPATATPTSQVAPVAVAAKNTKPTASAPAKPAAPTTKLVARAALPKPLGLGAPKAPQAPNKAATPKIPKVISCLAGETYQPKTKTCLKPATTVKNAPTLKVAPPKST